MKENWGVPFVLKSVNYISVVHLAGIGAPSRQRDPGPEASGHQARAGGMTARVPYGAGG